MIFRVYQKVSMFCSSTWPSVCQSFGRDSQANRPVPRYFRPRIGTALRIMVATYISNTRVLHGCRSSAHDCCYQCVKYNPPGVSHWIGNCAPACCILLFCSPHLQVVAAFMVTERWLGSTTQGNGCHTRSSILVAHFGRCR